MNQGVVRWYSLSKGCGFIIPDDGGSDLFAHFTGVADGPSGLLHASQRVRYELTAGPKGGVAVNIRPVR